jgi:hypothetical protein
MDHSMIDSKSAGSRSLGLRAGDWVEVRSAEEILATLDGRGNLDALPFMPEMLQYCGRKFRVFKSAHKTCDTISTYRNRRMEDAVHLEGLRCDGTAHDGCQAACLLFWKETWLKPVRGPESTGGRTEQPSTRRDGLQGKASHCDLETLTRAVRVKAGTPESSEELYSCQATEMVRATTPLKWWDPRQYARDLLSRNVGLWDFLRYGALGTLKAGMRLYWRVGNYWEIRGSAGHKTPTANLNLRPGEPVQVRSKKEILATLNDDGKNRGLSFDSVLRASVSSPFPSREDHQRQERENDPLAQRMHHSGWGYVQRVSQQAPHVLPQSHLPVLARNLAETGTAGLRGRKYDR